jgi:hypothetical protein
MAQPEQSGITGANSLDGVTFEVIVHRLRPGEARGGEWLVRVYAAGEHVHSAEGGVPLNIGLNEAHRAMGDWLASNGGGPR